MDKNYVDEDDQWKGIVAVASSDIYSTFHATNEKSPGQLVFGIDIIVAIEHAAYWRLMYQRKQTAIYKNTEKENSTRTNHHFQKDDQVLIRNSQAN